MEEIKDRIHSLMVSKNLSSAQLADTIGVQRSSISHILSGRNKPSIDFIQKLLQAFNDIDSTWLITGTSALNSDILSPKNDSHDLFNQEFSQNPVNSTEKIEISDSQRFDVAARSTDKEIDKIVVFYTDKTFVEYKPQ